MCFKSISVNFYIFKKIQELFQIYVKNYYQINHYPTFDIYVLDYLQIKKLLIIAFAHGMSPLSQYNFAHVTKDKNNTNSGRNSSMENFLAKK